MHPLDQSVAIRELLLLSCAPQHHHKQSALEVPHEGLPSARVAPRLPPQTPSPQQPVGVLQQTDTRHLVPVLADVSGPHRVLAGGDYLGEEWDFEALGGEMGDVEGGTDVAGEAVGSGEGGVLELHICCVLLHEGEEEGEIGLPVGLIEVEAAEVLPPLLLEEEAAQVVGDGQGDVVGGDQHEGVEGVFEREEAVLVEGEAGAADPAVALGDEYLEVSNGEEVLLEDVVGGVEGHQFGNAGDVVQLPVLVPLDHCSLLQVEHQPLLRSHVAERHLPQHLVLLLQA